MSEANNMNTQERKVMELALEALETLTEGHSLSGKKLGVKAITDIKEALNRGAMDSSPTNGEAQPEQDWIERERAVGYREGHQNALKQMSQPEPSPEWMTEEEQTAYTFGWFKALEKNNGSR